MTEYNQTRHKIKKQMRQMSNKDVIPRMGNTTARVDLKLIDKLYTIVDKIEKICTPFPLEFKMILEIIKQMKIRKRKKRAGSKNKSIIKSSQPQNATFKDSEKNGSQILFNKK